MTLSMHLTEKPWLWIYINDGGGVTQPLWTKSPLRDKAKTVSHRRDAKNAEVKLKVFFGLTLIIYLDALDEQDKSCSPQCRKDAKEPFKAGASLRLK